MSANDLKPSWVRNGIAFLVDEYRDSKVMAVFTVCVFLMLFGALVGLVGLLFWQAPWPMIGVVLTVFVIWRVLTFLDRNWPS